RVRNLATRGIPASPCAARKRLRHSASRRRSASVRRGSCTAAGSRHLARPVSALLESAARCPRDRACPRKTRTTHSHSATERHTVTETLGPFTEPHREIRHKQIAAGEARVSHFRRSYDAPLEDVWDACTDPVRLKRWF